MILRNGITIRPERQRRANPKLSYEDFRNHARWTDYEVAIEDSKIRVGIVEANPHRGFASIAHIPALQALGNFEITAVCTTRQGQSC